MRIPSRAAQGPSSSSGGGGGNAFPGAATGAPFGPRPPPAWEPRPPTPEALARLSPAFDALSECSSYRQLADWLAGQAAKAESTATGASGGVWQLEGALAVAALMQVGD